jgi:hypothetical protein
MRELRVIYPSSHIANDIAWVSAHLDGALLLVEILGHRYGWFPPITSLETLPCQSEPSVFFQEP